MKLWQVFSILLFFFLPTQLGRHFWPNYSYIYGIRIDYLSPTFYLTDLLLFFSLFFWLREPGNFRKISQGFLLKTFLVLIGVSLNVIFAKNQTLAIFKSLKIFELFLLIFLVAKENNFFLKLAELLSPVLVIIQFFLCLFQFFKAGSLGGFFWYLGERTFTLSTPGIAKISLGGRVFLRPYGTFSHPNSLAGFFLIILLLIIWKKNKKITDYFSIIVGVLLLLLSYSRTVWLVSLILLSIFFCFWIFRSLGKKKDLFFSYGKIILGLMVLFFSFIFIKSTIEIESISRRVEISKAAAALIKNNLLFGVGLNNFIPQIVKLPSFQGGGFWLQPVHNFLLLILSETGVFGLAIFFFVNIIIFRQIYKKENYKSLIILITILLTGLSDHYWFTLQQNFMLMGIVLGLGFEKN